VDSGGTAMAADDDDGRCSGGVLHGRREVRGAPRRQKERGSGSAQELTEGDDLAAALH
jgi:hypothetical protein